METLEIGVISFRCRIEGVDMDQRPGLAGNGGFAHPHQRQRRACRRVAVQYQQTVLDELGAEQLVDLVGGAHFIYQCPAGADHRIIHERIVHNGLQLDHARHAAPIFAQGMLAEDRMTIGLSLTHRAPVTVNGRRVEAFDLHVCPEGQDIVCRAEAPVCWLTLTVFRSVLQRFARDLLGRPLMLPEHDLVFVCAMPQHRSTIAHAALTTLHACRVDAKDSGFSAIALHLDGLLASMLCVMETALQFKAHCSNDILSRRHRLLVRDVIAYLETRLSDPFSTAALCRATGVKARTLQQTFHQVTGTTLAKWHRTQRLNRVRQDLMQSAL